VNIPIYTALEQLYRNYLIRDWQPGDRQSVAHLISSVLAEYGLSWEPDATDRDAVEVESAYLQTGGEFWVIEGDRQLVGTGAYHPISKGHNAVEIRKMYLLPSVRGQGLGSFLLQTLESRIQAQGYQEIWVETASVLQEAIWLYERRGYQRATGVETPRCDRLYIKTLVDVFTT